MLIAVQKELNLAVEQRVTTGNFRVSFINTIIEEQRSPDGVVNWEKVKQFTLHYNAKTIQSAYERLEVVPTSVDMRGYDSDSEDDQLDE